MPRDPQEFAELFGAKIVGEVPEGVRMTEQEWAGCHDSKKMLDFVRRKASGRKLRLYCCACCRMKGVGNWLAPESLAALETVERAADGLAGEEDLARAHQEAELAMSMEVDRLMDFGTHTFGPGAWATSAISSATANYHPADAAESVAEYCRWTGSQFIASGQCTFLRDLFGNPFSPVAVDPAWLNSTVLQLARAAYDERQLPEGTLDRTRLAILADAIEEAGCTSAEVLGHLRGPGPHVRGCWPVDLILNKG